jgi:hypothetical protein
MAPPPTRSCAAWSAHSPADTSSRPYLLPQSDRPTPKCGCSTSEAPPRTAEVRTIVIGKAAAGDRPSGRTHSGTRGLSDRPAAVRCAKARSASRPAGHSESGWSDNVSADVERTPDATSSSQNLTQTFRSRRPRIPTPLPRRRSEPVAPDGAVPGRGHMSGLQASNPRWPTRGGTPCGPGLGRGVCALRSGRRVGDAGMPAGSGRPMIPVETRCLRLRPSDAMSGCRCGSPSPPCRRAASLLSVRLRRHIDNLLSIRALQAPKGNSGQVERSALTARRPRSRLA